MVRKAAAVPPSKFYELLWNEAGGIVVLATCNRVEFYWYGVRRKVLGRIARVLSKEAGISMDACMHVLDGMDAVKHLFRVAAGLDSMMIGETEILGQVAEALKEARSHGRLAQHLELLFLRAVHVGRRVRVETGVSRGAVSIPLASVRIAERILGSLRGKRILIVGAGTAASLILSEVSSRKPRQVTVLNRTVEKAEALAHRWGAKWGSLGELEKYLGESDVVFVAVAGAPRLISGKTLEGTGGKPLIIDLSVPSAVEDHAGSSIIRIEALRREAEENAARRKAEALKAEAIVEEEAELFSKLARRMEADKVISIIMRRAEKIRRRETDKALGILARRGFPATNGAAEIIEVMGKSIARKILNPVYNAAREAAEKGDYSRLSLLLELLGGEDD